MISAQQRTDLIQRINAIVHLAREIEAVPNFGPDLWTMREIDKKCQVIRSHCGVVGTYIGTGDVLHSTSLPPGMHPISGDGAQLAQRHLNRIRVLAQAIEDVPNFGPDLWSMRKIDEECREIVWHASQVWPAIHPAGTSG